MYVCTCAGTFGTCCARVPACARVRVRVRVRVCARVRACARARVHARVCDVSCAHARLFACEDGNEV